MRGDETSMRTLIVGILILVPWVGLANAQQANSDTTAEVKKEIMKLEEEKISALGNGVSAIVEWFDRVNSDDLAHTDPISGVRTKAQCIAEFQNGKLKVNPVTTSDYRVRVHGNGNTAILTYRTNNVVTRGDNKPYTHEQFITDIYVKEGGVWQRVAHTATPVPASQAGESTTQ
jgi:ketosteroid isomerase-like protein